MSQVNEVETSNHGKTNHSHINHKANDKKIKEVKKEDLELNTEKKPEDLPKNQDHENKEASPDKANPEYASLDKIECIEEKDTRTEIGPENEDKTDKEALDETENENDPETLKSEIEKYKNLALRSRADYDNLKKRVDRQRLETKNFLIREIAAGILTSMDDFERALHTMGSPQTPEEKGEKFDSVVQGVGMVIEKINTFLKGFGVEETGFVEEEFNPTFHEAIMVEESDNSLGQKIGAVFQKGYKIEDFVIRTAKVKVIKGKQENNNTDGKPADGGQ